MKAEVFLITSVNSEGRVIKLEQWAGSAAEAAKVSGLSDQTIIDISRKNWSLPLMLAPSVRHSDRLTFCESLLQLLNSGFTLNESLNILQRQPTGMTRSLSESIMAQLSMGRSPAAAFAQSNGNWPDLLISLLRAGENNGEIASCMTRFCDIEKHALAMRSRLISASLYPAGMLMFSGVVMFFLLAFVVPKFATLVEDPNRPLPFASRAVFWVSNQVASNVPIVLLTLLCIVITVGAIARSQTLRAKLMHIARGFPLIGTLSEQVENAQLNRVLAALINGGLPITQAIERAASQRSSTSLGKTQIAKEAVMRGEPPSRAMFEAGILTNLESELLASAERGGQLGPMIERVANHQQEAVTRQLERLTALYSPVLLFVVALLVGAVVIALYWPLLDVFESVR